MQLTKTLITLAMGLTVASALVLPAADGLEARADKKGGNNKANNCANAKKLAAGIDDNIKIQKQEQSNVADIEKIVNSNNVDQKKFDAAKKTLLATIDDGIKIREANQKLADGNGAKDGLATVANAQAQEKSQAQGLKGTKADLDTIATLKKEFAGGIEQNQKNKEAATKGC
ncbi:hypothetical protein CGCVW01_v001945 [Colletotrichum viniferum]|nr:hypothetical protein CGCVW01_v001945 [Colletotrichum viniferum]